MLQAIRSKAGSFVVKLLFAVLIISFGYWGIADIFGNRTPAETTVASVGSLDISADELQTAVKQQIDRMSGLFGGNLTPEQARQLGVIDSVLDGLVRNDLLALEERRLGVEVDDQVVRDAILADPTFHNSSGAFDRNLFESTLFSNNLSEDRYVALLRAEIGRNELTRAVSSGALPPALLIDTLYRARNEKRSAEAILVASGGLAVAQPTEADLEGYYKGHQDLFRTPEFRGFTALIVTPDLLARSITIPETQLQTDYKSRIAEFSTPDRRQLQQIVLPDEAKAKEAAAQLASGKSFAEVAKSVANQSGDEIELGWVTRQDMLPALADPVFKLKEGETSLPVQSPLGWHIFKVTGMQAATVKPFEQVRQQLATEAAREMASDRIDKLANQVEDALAGGATVEEIAAKFQLAPTKVGAVDPAGKDQKGATVDLPDAPDVLRAAFGTENGQTTPLNQTKDNGYFVLHVNRVIKPAVQPLAEVKDRVAGLLVADRRGAAAAAEAKEIVSGLAAGRSLADLAAARHLTVDTLSDVPRSGTGDLPAGLVADLFKLKLGQTATAAGPQGWYVARLTGVKTPDPAADKAAVADFAKQIAADMRSDLLAEYEQALRQRFPVTIDRARANGVL